LAAKTAGVRPDKLHTIQQFLQGHQAWSEVEDRRQAAAEKRQEQRLLCGELEAADPRWSAEAEKLRRRLEAERAAKARQERDESTLVTQAELKRKKQTLLSMAKSYAKMLTSK
jgi:hypothetical protein